MVVARFKTKAVGVVTLLVGLLWSSSVWSDTVMMTNGDRLSGKVLLMDSGKLVLDTSYAGEIRIDWAEVAHLETDDPLLLRADNSSVDHEVRLVRGQQAGLLTVVGADAVGGTDGPAAEGLYQEIPASDVQRIVRPNAFLRDWSFEGGVDVALDATYSSSRNQNWSTAARLEARRDLWRHGMTLNFERKTQDGVVGTYDYDAAYTIDRFLSEKLFMRGGIRYGRDRIDNPAHELVLSAGPGYQLWDNELGSFSIFALATHTRYKYHDTTRDNFQTVGLGWKYERYLGGKQWQIFSHGDAQRALRSAGDYRLEADLGLRYSVTQWMSLYAKASYNRVYITNQPSTNERKYSVGMGVNW